MNVMSDKRTEQLLELMKAKFPALQGGVITEYGSNYVKFDMGLIIQFGRFDAAQEEATTVTLPVPFTTITYRVMLEHLYAKSVTSPYNETILRDNFTNSTFEIYNSGTSTVAIYYIAIGF